MSATTLNAPLKGKRIRTNGGFSQETSAFRHEPSLADRLDAKQGLPPCREPRDLALTASRSLGAKRESNPYLHIFTIFAGQTPRPKLA
ncbi:uncharacterized protein BDCG_05632 [Blastomyces dermatitidis ER-3]|uniref:Uncharacterized protein n=3 Tax=Blastomyces TaxID=229219 RepID=A0A179UQ00_BLAGS|nr:uncharacterized protein BDBG_17319 [Blastomyces gilchristii SLH14081]XP_045277232.1 uncharacterized protein BDCG_05632 [Blastomyces dermatitidis ER-3]EGE85897.2 hypothetical protein BDDG_08842 [Blastomyces dermatitidis ATCC 18188]EQL34274.1 hypothetical protein BDFG_03804 [Blastomyces dermatitidis ATCC 26199]EEQ90512.2 hypothetical protein BDCG_05632 [Blastomyces dermatitidis ER-3]OAT10155.1 hypothetical protein BDBG_17319 [Blastomyces gilchristii SLH14081]